MQESWQSGKRYFVVLCIAVFLFIAGFQALLISDGRATIMSAAIDWLIGIILVAFTIGLMRLGKQANKF